jgi:ferredoxin-NADP reductase
MVAGSGIAPLVAVTETMNATQGNAKYLTAISCMSVEVLGLRNAIALVTAFDEFR